MPRPPKIDIDKLQVMLEREGKSPKECAEYFGVSPAAISKARKALGVSMNRFAVTARTEEIVDGKLNAVAQLQKINENANELLDLCMRWQRGDDVALRILESQVKKIMVGKGENAQEVKRFKFKDPRELALKAMNEIRGQLNLQLEIFKVLYHAEAVKEFQTELVELLGEVDPEIRAEFIRRLREKGVVYGYFENPPPN